MTRDDVLADYRVQDGYIVSPGKFEGEPVYAPYFWSLALEGGAVEDDIDGGLRVEVAPEDMREFPELANVRAVCLWECDCGFVRVALDYLREETRQ